MADQEPFDPEGDGYDYVSAIAAGMQPASEGENKGHWGSVTLVSQSLRERLNLPEESYLVLKGKKHKTWNLAKAAEEERGFKIIKLGERYFSVPKEWMP